ncbi:MAG: DUF5703 domain-containing protein [Planctomycetota bacterium]|jgi:hypothetical protein
MRSSLFCSVSLALCLLNPACDGAARLSGDYAAGALEEYNGAWESQSSSSTGSMPLGGGSIGLNVWVEDGELLFYISSPDAIDENSALLKLGRVRLRFFPNPFGKDGTFRQELKLSESSIHITGETKDAGRAEILMWVDVFRPVIHVEVEATRPLVVEAAFETWRHVKRQPVEPWEMPKHRAIWRHSIIDLRDSGHPACTYPDHVEHTPGGVLWYHRNREEADVRNLMIKQQGLTDVAEKVPNPTKDLTFGGLLTAEDLVPAGTETGEYMQVPFKAWKLRTARRARRHHLRVALRIEQDRSIDDWKAAVLKLAERAERDAPADRRRTLAWWRDFWNRTHVRINPGKAGEQDEGWQVGRNYQLFRYMLGCNVFGKFPTKFNGGIFTFGQMKFSPDFRVWGGAGMFMAQNQRLVYWPMLKSGDFDLMLPEFNFYRDRVEIQRTRAKLYWGIDGTPFPESINAFGLQTGWVYGWWGRKNLQPGVPLLRHLRYHYTTAAEFAYMMLEYERFTGEDITEYLPVIEGMVAFYDQFYRMKCKERTGKELDDNGRLVLFPAQGLEHCCMATNPADAIAGLMAITDGLLALPQKYLSPEKRAYYEDFRRRIPPIPFRQTQGRKTIAPAESWEYIGTRHEFPNLYPVFPFDIYGLGKPGLQIAKDTWTHGYEPPHPHAHKGHTDWSQHGIFTARLGMTDEAKDYCVKKFLRKPKAALGIRFPAFYHTGGDQHPDHDHAGCAMIGLQEMLMQTDGKNIRLLPAWPKEWDVDFKLRAPYQTVVEGSVRDGRATALKVTPQSRRKDVIFTESK